MTQTVSWIFGLVLLTGLAAEGQAQCSISVAEPRICVRATVVATIRCQNETREALEWLDVDDRRALWDLARPGGSRETAYRSRYLQSSRLISISPGQSSELVAPLTRWFSFSAAGPYRLRFRLLDASGSLRLESNEVSIEAVSCDAGVVLAACRKFLDKSAVNLEAIGGFDSEAALPCMEEALAIKSAPSTSVLEGLARINTSRSVAILVKHFGSADAFDRLTIWQALHRVDTSSLSPELRENVSLILREIPVTVKD